MTTPSNYIIRTVDPAKIAEAKAKAEESYLHYQDLVQDEHTDTMTVMIAADNAVDHMDAYIDILTTAMEDIGASVDAYIAAITTTPCDGEELF